MITDHRVVSQLEQELPPACLTEVLELLSEPAYSRLQVNYESGFLNFTWRTRLQSAQSDLHKVTRTYTLLQQRRHDWRLGMLFGNTEGRNFFLQPLFTVYSASFVQSYGPLPPDVVSVDLGRLRPFLPRLWSSRWFLAGPPVGQIEQVDLDTFSPEQVASVLKVLLPSFLTPVERLALGV